MIDLGIVRPGSTIRIPFSSFDKDDGSAVTMTNYAAADILIYKDGSTTERASTAGFTATTDFDGKTGKHLAIIDLSDNTTAGFYAAGSEYLVAIDSVTIDGVTTGGWVARFRIGYHAAIFNTTIATLSSQTSFTLTDGPAEDDALNGMLVLIHDVASAVQCSFAVVQDYTGSTKTVTLAAAPTFTVAASDNFAVMGPAPLQPTTEKLQTAARTLDVSSGGEAGLDWANVGSPTTTVNLSGTTIATTQQVDVNTIKTQTVTCSGGVTVPAATLASTTNIAAGTITTVTNLTNAPTAGDFTATMKTSIGTAVAASAVASVTGNVGGNVTGSVGSVAAGGITAASIATDAIDADALAADAIAEINATVDTALADYDAPTRAELTSDINSVLAYLDGLVITKGTIGGTGNDTTHLHLTGLTYGDDEINNYLLAVKDVSTGEWHARYVEDWVNATELATVATLPFTPQDSTDLYVLLAFRQDVTGGSGLDAAGVRAAIGLASANLDTQLGTIDTNVDSILADTGTDGVLVSSGTGTGQISVSSGVVAANVTQFGGSNGTFASGVPAVNATQVSGSATAADNLQAEYDGTGYAYAITSGTAQAGASSTITLAAGSNGNDEYYTHLMIRLTGGTGAGQVRVVNAYNGTTKVATVSPAWTTAPDATTTYLLLAGTEVHVKEVHAGAITASSFAADVDAEILSYLVDDATRIDASALNTAAGAVGSDGSGLTEAGGAGDHLTAVPWNAAWDAEVQSEVDDALVANNLDHLCKTATAGADMTAEVADNTILSRVLANGDTSVFDPSTDGLQPIRDRGDAAWVTATGFSTHSAADVWAVATRVLTAGTNIALAKGTGVTGFNDLDAAGVRSAVGLASANLDTQLSTIAGYLDTEVAAILAAVDTEVGAIKAKTDSLTFTVAGQVDANVTNWKGSTAPAMTGDAFARLGAPAGASVSADIAAVKVDTAAVLDDTGTAGVVLTAAERNAVADALLSRSVSNVEGSAGEHTLCTVVLMSLESSVSGTTLTVKRTDGSTTHATKTVSTDADADPITGIS